MHISTNIHDVVSVTIKTTEHLSNAKTYVRDIVIVTADGSEYEITMFADSANSLVAKRD